MACTRTQQQRLRLRPPRGSRSFVLTAPTLLLLILCLFFAVFAQPSSCRPLGLGDDHHTTTTSTNNGDVILLPLPADTQTMVVAGTAPPAVSTEDEDRRWHRHRLAAGRHQWLLNKKPRGKPPPSAPSKRTN
ncbi:hypothetical protein BDA96_08G034900 [Sorghum bicolor]|uniref:Uncharacterized protein n=1 Tax=Sorghum bicolor TaxID=4558 RepID=A0A921QFC7_SORBI|nr:hypothetical protein BDA96_08G034900 [Sorghum bicolor]